MPLIETMTLEVGPVIAKTLLKRWLGVGLATDLSGTITDLLKGQLSDRLTQRRASRQLEAIGELVAESLLPSDRLELYRVCCHLLVERRDQTRGVSLKDYPAVDLDYHQKCMLLEDLAYYLIKNGWTQLKRDNIDKRFSRTLSNMQNIPKDMTGVAARRYFVERSGIIREPVVNVIEFAHRTFQEYLAARAIVDNDDLGVLVNHAHNDQWRELISMASGLFRKKMREDLIAELLGRGEAEKAYRYQLFTLAALCSQAAAERLSKRTRLRMERRLKEITPPKTMQEAEVLATAGELAVPHLHMRYEYSAEVAAACVRALTLINNTAALDILEEYTNDASGTVVQELFMGLNRVDENEKRRYAQRILARFTKSPYVWEGSLDGFQYLEHIVELRLGSLVSFEDVPLLGHLEHLTSLSLSTLPTLTDLGPLEHLEHLTSLSLSDLPTLTDLGPLGQLTHLTTLRLHNIGAITDLTSLVALWDLTYLELGDCSLLKSFEPLTALKKLESLVLWHLSASVLLPEELKGKVRLMRDAASYEEVY